MFHGERASMFKDNEWLGKIIKKIGQKFNLQNHKQNRDLWREISIRSAKDASTTWKRVMRQKNVSRVVGREKVSIFKLGWTDCIILYINCFHVFGFIQVIYCTTLMFYYPWPKSYNLILIYFYLRGYKCSGKVFVHLYH